VESKKNNHSAKNNATMFIVELMVEKSHHGALGGEHSVNDSMAKSK
jgi:hypothetical protein